LSLNKVLGSKIFGAAALLAALCAPAMSLAGEASTAVAHPFVLLRGHSDSGCRKSWNATYHYRYHYRAYRPRVSVTPRKYYPHKKKKPFVGF
jgi:hypothetical protein